MKLKKVLISNYYFENKQNSFDIFFAIAKINKLLFK